MGAFKAYDIRGIFGKDLTTELVYKIGYHLPNLLQCDHIIVGRDVRLSSDKMFDALSSGITDAGCDVWNIGLATTPMVYFATVLLNAGGSVQITASHNPPEYNGLKISKTKALPVGENSGLKELERMVGTSEIVVASKKGRIIDKGVKFEYLSFLRQYVPNLNDLSLSIDLSHGMANLLVKDLLGDSHHYLYDHFDGTFPAHEPNPLVEENCEDIKNAVLKNHSDVGVIFDGDADRVMFIDERGRFIQPDYITAVLGTYFLKNEKGNVLQDIRTSRSTTEYLEKLGAEVVTWRVGHAFAKVKLREIDGIFGGELAGHYYFRDFFYCDSGILASLIVLQVVADLKKQGKTFSTLIDEIVTYANSGEINFKLDKKDDAVKALYDEYVKNDKPTAVMDFDGYRVEFPTWWFNVRKSNTEPYLRLVVEARTKKELDEKVSRLSTTITSFT
ncbi:MAG: phosphomannomutase/phosphoglucomutase [Sphaerochaetaceae bacterium]|nr:phosphomannomutase/phosphoglucomutase [Sphaerochaetaceae bacterium]NLO60961.1 phosphomannomutase/phosphoglucomutase [Spirochaetales bacterium]MDD2405159.1 phosphomannomutase/phosphoglucomutase [Sphaerochaetaceae bacterium]MDD3670048.1 phosphomannomutase/phosphoglucomutase [Sphaerochaetaceae bacterium]MDD4259347.1 phosphomannomutase/phosphoglucomutase [Sphaerochaetaceae bacterium]